MSDPITITAEEFDLLYHRIMLHLSGIDRVGLPLDIATVGKPIGSAARSAMSCSWSLTTWAGESRGGDDPVELTSPPDVVRHLAAFLREMTSAGDADGEARQEIKAAEAENREVRELCDRLLAALDGAPAAPGRAG